MEKFIPVNEPNISESDIEYAYDAIKSGFWSGTSGKYIKEFEDRFSKFIGTKYGVSCANGTVALQLAVRALGLKEGDEVISSAFTNIASILCVVYEGATPVLVDSRKDTWCMDEEKIEEKITKKTKAIIPVHIYGHPCKMDTIVKIAKKHNLKIIEDAAEAHGAEFEGKKIGNFGNISCFSFYSTKIVQCFPLGTKILIEPPKGTKGLSRMKNIENINVGDIVLTYNTDTSAKEYKRVTRTFKNNYSGELIELKFSNNNKIKLTPNHPVYVIGKGWIDACDLTLGDEVIQYIYRGLSYKEKYTGKRWEEISGHNKASIRKQMTALKSKVLWVSAKESGKIMGNTGKHHSIATKTLMSKHWENEAYRSKMLKMLSENGKKRTPFFLGKKHRKESVDKIRDATIKNMQNPEWHKKISNRVKKAMEDRTYWVHYFEGLNAKPNKKEIKLKGIIDTLFPNEYGYNGDFGLGIMIDRLIPDFVNINGKKKVIELFGNRWHDKEEESEKIERYNKLGFQCLIIWENELENTKILETRIKDFNFNPNIKIVKLTDKITVPHNDYVYNIETEDNHNYFAYGILVHNCGEGGMSLTDDAEVAKKLNNLKGLAYGTTNTTRFIHTDLGYNFRLNNISAAIGAAQMLKIDDIIKKRIEMADYYTKGLKNIPGLQLPVKMPWAKNVYWVYGIVVNEKEFGMNRDKLMDELFKKGIDTRPFFASMSLQPALHKIGLFKNDKMPVSEWLGKNGLYLPSSSKLTREQMDYVIKTVKALHHSK